MKVGGALNPVGRWYCEFRWTSLYGGEFCLTNSPIFWNTKASVNTQEDGYNCFDNELVKEWLLKKVTSSSLCWKWENKCLKSDSSSSLFSSSSSPWWCLLAWWWSSEWWLCTTITCSKSWWWCGMRLCPSSIARAVNIINMEPYFLNINRKSTNNLNNVCLMTKNWLPTIQFWLSILFFITLFVQQNRQQK